MARSDLKDRRRRCFVDLLQAEQDLAAARKDHDLAVAGEAPVARLRELAARIAAFEADVAALERRRDLLAAEATKVDLAAAEQARIEAIEATIKPLLTELVELTERFEQELAVPAATYARIEDLFDQQKAKWPRGAVPIPPEYFRFTLNGLTSRLKIALESCARSHDFENVVARLHMFHTQEPPSVVMKKQLAQFLEELRQMPLPQSKNIEGVS
jgi:hypothetical protein